LISRLRIGLLAALVVAAGGAATWGALTLAPRRPAGPPSLAATVTTAVVTRETISDQQQETGTIGYSASYAVVNQYAPPPSAAVLARDQDQVRAAQQALSDVQAQNALTEQQDAAAHDQARQASDLVAGATKLHQAQAAVRTAQDQAAVDAQPGGGGGSGGGTSAIYTSLPAAGQTVRRGQTLYAVAGRPIPLLYGGTPIGRQLTPGVSGADVQELETNLIALGYGTGLTADGSFTSADSAAIRRWQAALGVARSGVVNPGEAVVLPEALLVSQVKVAPGASAQAGAEIIDGTSTTPVVTIDLDARDRTLAKVGEAVTVRLPGTDQAVEGTIAAVGTVATTSGQGSSQTTTVPVTVTLADGGAAGGLDGASVTVTIASQTHENVLTVPIVALIPEPGGGYAVETAGGAHRRIVVQTGVFSDSRVEVSGPGLVEGLRVESPSL
jgi:Putative peptidoglycan binding domain